ncbi:MAG TPA: prepilin-type N-terminal cleavage/methylation domain-containing protein [Usitatibacter sp.]|nr:prepilin-type N-terminal cleavage/methylation domain-containing protein [Usitatibacter sp.]
MTPRRHEGFTLLEVVVALTILGAMMVLLYAGLSFGLRSWDAGDAVGRGAADRRIGESFLRRELGELFPMRFKDAMRLRFAFEGKPDSLRFVSSRPAGLQMGGLSLVGLEAAGDARRNERALYMRRAMPDDNADSFAPLDAAEPTVLLTDVDSVRFSYFGSESDFAEPRWVDEWTFVQRVPQLVRVQVQRRDGTRMPDMVVRIMLGEEAGCLENSFQRLCRPRRPIGP